MLNICQPDSVSIAEIEGTLTFMEEASMKEKISRRKVLQVGAVATVAGAVGVAPKVARAASKKKKIKL